MNLSVSIDEEWLYRLHAFETRHSLGEAKYPGTSSLRREARTCRYLAFLSRAKEFGRWCAVHYFFCSQLSEGVRHVHIVLLKDPTSVTQQFERTDSWGSQHKPLRQQDFIQQCRSSGARKRGFQQSVNLPKVFTQRKSLVSKRKRILL